MENIVIVFSTGHGEIMDHKDYDKIQKSLDKKLYIELEKINDDFKSRKN